MQDGAPLHITNPLKQLLKRHFGNASIISRHLPTVWPSRLSNLNPCDFCLWGYMKDIVFSAPIANLAEWKARIAQHILNVTPEILRSVVENTVSRFQLVAKNGGQLWTCFTPVSRNLKNDLMDAFYAVFDLRIIKNRFFPSVAYWIHELPELHLYSHAHWTVQLVERATYTLAVVLRFICRRTLLNDCGYRAIYF